MTSSAERSSIGIAGAIRRGEVHRRDRRDDVQRDPVPLRQDGERIRADLVGRVAVGRDPVRADEHDVDPARRHQRRRPRRPAGGCDRRPPVRAPRPSGGRPGGMAASRRPRRGSGARRGGPPGRCRGRSRTGRRRAARCCSGSGPRAAGPRAAAAGPGPRSAIRPWSSVASATIAIASSHIAAAIASPSSLRSPTAT